MPSWTQARASNEAQRLDGRPHWQRIDLGIRADDSQPLRMGPGYLSMWVPALGYRRGPLSDALALLYMTVSLRN